MKNFISSILIVLSLLCFGIAGLLYWQRVNPNRIKFDSIPSVATDNNDILEPTGVIIDSIKISLPIYPVAGWDVSSKGVSYLSSSPIPGSAGNSILYGHNWNNLLGNLVNIKRGDSVLIVYNNGSTKEFIVKDLQIVSPDQVEVLENTKDIKLTIYTCTGFLDGKRFIVSAYHQEDLAGDL